MTGLTLKDIRKSYGSVDVLHGIDLDIKQGEFIVFVGPSGCGKSTLLRMIAGLEAITGGEMYIDGHLVNDVPPSKRGMISDTLPGGPMHNPDVTNPGGAVAVTPNSVATPQPGNPAGAPAVSEPSGHQLPVQPAQPAPR